MSSRAASVQAMLRGATRMLSGGDEPCVQGDRPRFTTIEVRFGVLWHKVKSTVARVAIPNHLATSLGPFAGLNYWAAGAHLRVEAAAVPLVRRRSVRLVANSPGDSLITSSAAELSISPAEAREKDNIPGRRCGFGFAWKRHGHPWHEAGKALATMLGSPAWQRRRLSDALFAEEVI